MHRDAKQIIVLGFNGTGKTTLLRELIEKAIKAGRRALIIVPDLNDWRDIEEIEPDPKLLRKGGFEGVHKILFMGIQETLIPVAEYYFDGLLFFDDCRSYLPANTPMSLKNLFIRRRQKMLDVFLIAHGFTDIPPQYYTNTSDYILFFTNDEIELRRKYIKNYEVIKKIVDQVNKKAQKDYHYKRMVNVLSAAANN